MSAPPRRRPSLIPSCFRGPLVSDADEGPVSNLGSPRRRTSWFLSCSSFRGKKKTVPFHSSPETMAIVKLAGIETKVTANLSSPSFKIRKDKAKDKDKSSRERTKKHHHQPLPPSTTEGTRLHLSTICTQPNAIHGMQYSAKTDIATSHPIPLKQQHTSVVAATRRKCEEINVDAGIVMVAMSLAMLLLGRACAVLCMSAWFYLLPRLRGGRKSEVQKSSLVLTKNRSFAVAGEDSQEYKKKVVLQGLLERNRARPTALLVAR